MKLPLTRIKRILVIRNDRFGEFLLNLPVFARLKEAFPDSKITLIVKPQIEELARRIPVIDDVIIQDSLPARSIYQKFNLIKNLRNRHFDIVLVLNPSKEFNVCTFLAGIPVRVGYDRKLGFLLNVKIKDEKSQGKRHEVDYNLDLLRAIGIETDINDAKFPLDIEAEDLPQTKKISLGITNEPLIAIHPWSSNKDKEWPLVKFRELILKIHSELGIKSAVIGGKEEEERSETLCRNTNCINLTGKLNLVELGAFFKGCKLLVTNDSGPMHLAAVLQTPVVAIFRSMPPSINARRWGPVGNIYKIIEADMIDKIEIAEVFNGIKHFLVK